MDEDEDGGMNAGLPDRTDMQWQAIRFDGRATRESGQPRFSDLSLIIIITMRRRRMEPHIYRRCHELYDVQDELHLVVTGSKRDLRGKILHQESGSRS